MNQEEEINAEIEKMFPTTQKRHVSPLEAILKAAFIC
jgi:hypothetical protein